MIGYSCESWFKHKIDYISIALIAVKSSCSLSLLVLPFQIAYAVSIHKAQGLEYNSVKIVITDEVEELVTHNIFYTAITRAREKLKIYWTPEVEEKVIKRIKPRDISKDVELLKNYLIERI